MLATMGVLGAVPVLKTGTPTAIKKFSRIARRQFARATVFLPCLLRADEPGESDEELSEALQRIYLEHDFQQELPAVVEPEIPGWLSWLSKFLGDLGGLSVIGKLLMWGALLALLLLLVYWLATMDVGRISARLRKRFRPHAVSDGPASSRGAHADWLETADSLAGEGRYAAAIHALLLGVLGWMRTSNAYDWPPAATAREILNRCSGPRTPLEHLVRSAELAHFGGWIGTESDYLVCRAHAREYTAPPQQGEAV